MGSSFLNYLLNVLDGIKLEIWQHLHILLLQNPASTLSSINPAPLLNADQPRFHSVWYGVGKKREGIA